MNNHNNDLINQQKLNELANDSKIKLAQEKKEKSHEKELERKIFDSSPILRNLPRPVKIYKERNVMRALFTSLPSITKQSSVTDIAPPTAGILIPFYIEHQVRGDLRNDFHYLKIHYEIDLMDNNPIVLFKEEISDKSSI